MVLHRATGSRADDCWRQSVKVRLQIPVLTLVVAFTAIPVGLQLPGMERIAEVFRTDLGRRNLPDILANVLGYVPVGVVLANRGVWRAVGIASSVSLSAEVAQVFAVGRSPSFLDLVTNVVGTLIGVVLSARYGTRVPLIGVSRRRALAATALAFAYVAFGSAMTPRVLAKSAESFINVHAMPWLEANTRTNNSDGLLEAHWTFDSSRDGLVHDSSGNHLTGVLVGAPGLVTSDGKGSIELNGISQYVKLGGPASLRLMGSMTVTAQINSSSFPVDDAAIVSSRSKRELGYQLDTTVDQGPRTIGFKLTDPSGRIMARYGRTPLRTNTWYYVAGVYDAERRTLDVYLNGRRDNGCLLGTISPRQQFSGSEVYVGRRADLSGFEFAGSIADVKIYSKALTRDEIETDVRIKNAVTSDVSVATDSKDERTIATSSSEDACSSLQVPDGSTAGFLVGYGLLVGFASAGLGPRRPSRVTGLILSFLAGFPLCFLVSAWPESTVWAIPFLTLAGGASVAASFQPNPVAGNNR
jgi:VanZ family protein